MDGIYCLERNLVSSVPKRISWSLYAGTTAAIPILDRARAICDVSIISLGCRSRKDPLITPANFKSGGPIIKELGSLSEPKEK